jgi:hypothetical protein
MDSFVPARSLMIFRLTSKNQDLCVFLFVLRSCDVNSDVSEIHARCLATEANNIKKDVLLRGQVQLLFLIY